MDLESAVGHPKGAKRLRTKAPQARIEASRALLNAVNVAAGTMLQTLRRRGRHAWPADMIVDPRLIAAHGRGRSTKPGLELAVDAMEDLIALEGCGVRAASRYVARHMRNFFDDWWGRWPGSRTDDRERLNVTTLPAQLRHAFRRRHRKM
jgi:hypothetical protein